MTDLTNLPPMYDERTIILTPNDVHRVSLVATNIKFLEIEGDVRFRLNDNDSAAARQGIGFTAPEGIVYQSLTLQDVGGVGATVTFAYSTGGIEDNRSSIAGAIPVVNSTAPNDILNVNDAALEAAIATMQSRLDEIYARQLVDFTATTSATFTTSATIVTAAANVNGVYIANALVSCNSAVAATFQIGGTSVCGNGFGYTYNTPLIDKIENYYVPAGVEISYSVSVGINNRGSITYRIL